MLKNLNKTILIIGYLLCCAQATFAAVNFDGNVVYSNRQKADIISANVVFKTVYDDNNSKNNKTITFDSFRSKVEGVALDRNGTGFIVTKDGNLDYYENNKFIKTTHTFDDGANGLSYTGNAVYVITSDKSNYNEKALKKCSESGVDCKTIDTFQDYPQGVSFDENGNGYVVTRYALFKYVDDKYIGDSSHTFDDYPNAVSFTGNAVYVITQIKYRPSIASYLRGQLLKCTTDNIAKCTAIDDFYDEWPNGVSFDGSGNGYVDTDTSSSDGETYYKYTNNILSSYYIAK